MIKFNQKGWLQPYIEMNIKLRKKGKNNFEKDFFKLMNNEVSGKSMENVRKPYYHTKKFFTENLLGKEMRKTQIIMNKPVYLGLSILDLSKNAMY